MTVDGIQAKSEIKQRQGAVRATGLAGPLTLEADAREVVVEFSAAPAGADSSLTNEGGGMTVGLPGTGSFRVEAETRYGRIESTYAWIGVTESGDRAAGSPARGGSPIIKILAYGDLVLGPPPPPGGSAPQEAGSAGNEGEP